LRACRRVINAGKEQVVFGIRKFSESRVPGVKRGSKCLFGNSVWVANQPSALGRFQGILMESAPITLKYNLNLPSARLPVP